MLTFRFFGVDGCMTEAEALTAGMAGKLEDLGMDTVVLNGMADRIDHIFFINLQIIGCIFLSVFKMY